MKKFISLLTFISFFSLNGFAIEKDSIPFSNGETMRFKVKYGFIKAGYGQLVTYEKENSYHFRAKGWSTSFFDTFFKVRDYYDSYTSKDITPQIFKRDVKEGSYERVQQTTFGGGKATSKTDTIDCPTNTQDLVSFFYYLRKQNLQNLEMGASIEVPIYLNNEVFVTEFIYREDEEMDSILGDDTKCMVFDVKVASGRVFGDGEPLKVWITKDHQKVPVKLKTELAVGSIKMVLDTYKAGA